MKTHQIFAAPLHRIIKRSNNIVLFDIPQFQLHPLRQPSVVSIIVHLGSNVLGLVRVRALQVVADKARHEEVDPVNSKRVIQQTFCKIWLFTSDISHGQILGRALFPEF